MWKGRPTQFGVAIDALEQYWEGQITCLCHKLISQANHLSNAEMVPLWLFFALVTTAQVPLDPTVTLTRIAFGSCAGQFGVHNSNIWASLVAWRPQLFIWSGDVAYIDTLVMPFYSRYATPEEWKFKMQDTLDDPGYTALRNNTMITGTWDDHDSGMDDGDRTNLHFAFAKEMFLHFLNEPMDSARYRHLGVYHSLLFGHGTNTVKVILLDVRTFRDPWTYTDWSYEGDTLGEEQWKWLESELRNPGAVTLVVSGMCYPGLQVFVEDKYGVIDRWHPKSAARLADLLSQVPGAFILSGDVHQAEILHYTCTGRNLVEATSSGLTHSVKTQWGLLGVFYNYILVPFTWNHSTRYLQRNFGTIEIEWGNEPAITVAIRSELGKVIYEETWRRSETRLPMRVSPLCSQSGAERFLMQVSSALTLFVLPILLHATALIIVVRKFSKSY